jgi:glycosyltransferase involved in cell wall biosynthesis
MRILFLQKTTDAQGGSKASLRKTLDTLSELSEFEVELCGETQGVLSDFASRRSIPFKVAPFPRWRNLWDRLRFDSIMKRFAESLGEVDWIISNEMWWAPHAVALAKYCGARSAAIVRDEIADVKKAKQYNFNQLDQVITVSEDLRAQFKSALSLHKRTQTIYNIVDRPVVSDEVRAALKTLSSDCPKVNQWVLSAGTICPRKDQILLVKALAEMIRNHGAGTGILFVGGHDSSDYEARIRQAVVDCGVEDSVVFTGQIESIGAALEFASAKVLTSHSEGLPRVLIESALAGVPSISTKVSGVDEVYGSYAERCVLKTRDSVELAEKLTNLLDHRDDEIIRVMKSRAQARFSQQAHVDAWRQFLKMDNPESSRAG